MSGYNVMMNMLVLPIFKWSWLIGFWVMSGTKHLLRRVDIAYDFQANGRRRAVTQDHS